MEQRTQAMEMLSKLHALKAVGGHRPRLNPVLSVRGNREAVDGRNGGSGRGGAGGDGEDGEGRETGSKRKRQVGGDVSVGGLGVLGYGIPVAEVWKTTHRCNPSPSPSHSCRGGRARSCCAGRENVTPASRE